MKDDWLLDETSKIKSFCNSYDEIRIYGNGLYGTLVSDYLKTIGQSFSGYVVSDKYYQNMREDVLSLSEVANLIEDGTNIGLIIALKDDYYLNVFDSIKNVSIGFDRCFLIPGRLKKQLKDIKWEKERKLKENGEARDINTYTNFFKNVLECNTPGKINLICHQHLGDTCIVMGLKPEIEKHYRKEVSYIIRRAQACLPHIYGIKNYKTVVFDDFFDNDKTRGFSQQYLDEIRTEMFEGLFPRLPQEFFPFVSAPFAWNIRWEPKWKNLVNTRARLFGMDTTMINPPTGILEPSERFSEFVEKEGGWDRIALVAPEARANPQISLDYWESIVSKLKKEGFTVICNAMRKENRLEGTVDLNLSVSDLIALGQRCHEIHSTRSGLCDCLASRGSSLHVYYTNDLDREFEYYSLNNNFYLDDPVTEVMVND